MIGAIFRFLSSGLSVLNKLLPSWEWKGGQAAAERDQAERTADAQARMDAVAPVSERDVVERLRRKGF